MSPEEIRVRTVYLFLACSQLVEQLTQQLSAVFPDPPLSSMVLIHKYLRRELALLFRSWASREIWARLEHREGEAKSLNLSLLRLFTEGFKLPKDGSGLRYAELLTPIEEIHELHQRLATALGMDHSPLLHQLQTGIVTWRTTVLTVTRGALERPLEELTSSVKEWSGPLRG